MEEELKEILNRLREAESRIRRLKIHLKGALSLAKDHCKEVYRIEPLVQKIEDDINLIEFDNKGALQIVSQLKGTIQGLKEDFRFEFTKSLQGILESKGMKLRGQLPVLYTGFYRIETDFYQGKALIFFGPDKIGRFLLTPEGIAESIFNIHEGLRKNSVKEEDFIKNLFQAWNMSCYILKREKVPITHCLVRFAIISQKRQFYESPSRHNYRDYSRFQFAYDLYRLRKSGVKEIDGKELSLVSSTFDATRKKIDYIWVPTNENGEGINYSYITFR